jgi:hypothetical protein
MSGRFNFVRCAAENGAVYCLDAEGGIWELPLPKRISAYECPATALKSFLSKHSVSYVAARRRDYTGGRCE